MDKKEAKALLDTSAEKNRNLLIAFLLYLVTVTVLVLSVTDMDLLLGNKAFTLPLLGVDLLLTVFYIFLPALLLVLHFDLLQNAKEHRIKLATWLKCVQNAGPQLFPFIFDVAVVRYYHANNPKINLPKPLGETGQIQTADGERREYSATSEGGIKFHDPEKDLALATTKFALFPRSHPNTSLDHRLIAVVVWLLYLYFPLFVLALFLVRVADLQQGITLYHLALLVADGYLIYLFWGWEELGELPLLTRAHPFKKPLTWLKQNKSKTLAIGALCGYVFTVLYSWGALQSLHYGWLNPTSPLIKPIAFMAGSENFEWVLPRISVPASYPYKVSEDDIRLSLWADEAAHAKEANYHADKLAVWAKSSRPLDLHGRHLAFANLAGAQLRRVDLHDAYLQGADLSEAQLQDADLSAAQLQGADFTEAQLQGAKLGDAQLAVAKLSATDLQGADLVSANLAGADLGQAKLQGANLSWAELQGADLALAELTGAIFFKAQLQNATLKHSILQGVDLRFAQLQGANLAEAQLQKANLFLASLSWTQLQGADFSQAQLQGADLRWSKLQGANLNTAQLQGVDLRWSQFQGADFSNAQLQGAELSYARLQGANLHQAQLQGADLKWAQVRGVDWQGAQHQALYAPHLNRQESFDFGKVSSVNGNTKQRLQQAKQRQEAPPTMPKSLGTTESKVFAQGWLQNLCLPASNTQGVLAMLNNRLALADDASPYAAISLAAISARLQAKDCKPYVQAVYEQYPDLQVSLLSAP